ncbi:hypothetical protein ACM1TL_07420 [Lysinibacillus capsici]|uniref:hypothetical protein n=1 Tax=Lysinibacillus TaxID=400634 RepID=UPI0006CA06B0|nr:MULTISPECIES: hypothetical protein [Lysinibacillus]MCT1538323.1 hypothetical protein [Lysinibacillus capsici]MCT1569032.1 hypothetical protein [Lysinibacillus capsici]MCT1646047.1 hypothetical protein [Lysinibacillus capsici]MCT1725447.1 hypothetical protein [Lysinibacillus capsici]MCT1784227.1 hypothetical protein [Lysinibacillus capsici]
MKPFMLRHKLGWLPNKLEYRRTYIIGFKGETDESYTFMLTKNSKYVRLVNNNKEMVVRKRELKRYFKDGCLQFLTTQYEEHA